MNRLKAVVVAVFSLFSSATTSPRSVSQASEAGASELPLILVDQEEVRFYRRGQETVYVQPQRVRYAFTLDLSRVQDPGISFLPSPRRDHLRLVPLDPSVQAPDLRLIEFLDTTDVPTRQDDLEFIRTRGFVKYLGPVLHLSPTSVTFLTNQLIVRFKPTTTEHKRQELLGNLTTLRKLPYAPDSYLLTTGSLADYEILLDAERLFLSGFVVYAEPNLVTTSADLSVRPNDFRYQSPPPVMWHVDKIRLPDAWHLLRNVSQDLTFGSPQITLAIMDRGIPSSTITPSGGGPPRSTSRHPDFHGNLSNGQYKIYQFFDFPGCLSNNDSAVYSHGIHVSGIAGALAENCNLYSTIPWCADSNNPWMEGVVGAAPNSRLMALIRLDTPSFTEIVDSFLWAGGIAPYPCPDGWRSAPSPGADIISNSWFREFPCTPPCHDLPQPIQDAFVRLTNEGRGGKGVVLLFGVPPDNADGKHLLAANDSTLAIGGTIEDDGHFSNSACGNYIDISAPAVSLLTTAWMNGGRYIGHPYDVPPNLDYDHPYFTGTSGATALAAGVTALALSACPRLKWDEVGYILRQTAKKDGLGSCACGQTGDYSQCFGFGRIDALEAVRAAKNRCSLPPLCVSRYPQFPVYSVRTLPVPEPPPFLARVVAGVDLDSDGDTDLLASAIKEQSLVWLENVGEGTFLPHSLFAGPVWPGLMPAGDLDADGRPDVVVMLPAEKRTVFLENRPSERGIDWIQRPVSDLPLEPQSLVFTDLDGDDDPDILATQTEPKRILWLENNGIEGRTWDPHQIALSKEDPGDLLAVDLNADGDTDVVAAYPSAGKILWYRNPARAGTQWNRKVVSNDFPNPTSLGFADIDGDGDPDILASSPSQGRILWFENGEPAGKRWLPHMIPTTAQMVTFLTPIDFDSDGDLDILIPSLPECRLILLENVTCEENVFWQEWVIAQNCEPFASLLPADLDADGDVDLLPAAMDGQRILWLENEGPGPRHFPQPQGAAASPLR